MKLKNMPKQKKKGFEHQMEQFKNELDQRLLTGNEESKKALHESLKMISNWRRTRHHIGKKIGI